MTNTLTIARGELKDLLVDAGLTAVNYLPERPQPPMVIVTPGQPYLRRGEQFGTHVIGLTVLLLANKATNEVMTEELDDMIAAVTVAVFTAKGFNLKQVDPPSQFQVGNAQYLGCTADVTVTGVVEVS